MKVTRREMDQLAQLTMPANFKDLCRILGMERATKVLVASSYDIEMIAVVAPVAAGTDRGSPEPA